LNNKKVICLICCRSGSKRIKNKNIKNFNNKPLLEWTIKNAKKSNIFDEIIVSTDSNKIKNIALKNGAICPGLRPKFLSTDKSNQFDTHKYIFNKLAINDHNSYICILNNNPFINSFYLRKSLKIYKSYPDDIVADCIKVEGDYLAFKQFYLSDKKIKFINKSKFKTFNINRQSLDNYFVGIFNIRWGKTEYLSDFDIFKNKIINNGLKPIYLKKKHNFDLDDIEDWLIAESVFKYLQYS